MAIIDQTILLTSLRDINDDGFYADNDDAVSSCDGSCFPAQLIYSGWHFFQTEFPEQKSSNDFTFRRHFHVTFEAQPFRRPRPLCSSVSTFATKLLFYNFINLTQKTSFFSKKFPKGTVSSSGPFVPNFCKTKPKFAQICLSSVDFVVFQMEGDGSDLRPMPKSFQSDFKIFCHDWLQTLPSFFRGKVLS